MCDIEKKCGSKTIVLVVCFKTDVSGNSLIQHQWS